MPYDIFPSWGSGSTTNETAVSKNTDIPEKKQKDPKRVAAGKKAAETKKYNDFVRKKLTQRQINLAEQNADITKSIKELSEKALTSGRARVEEILKTNEQKTNAAKSVRNLLGVEENINLSEADIKNALNWSASNFSEKELIDAGITDETRKLYEQPSYKEAREAAQRKSIYDDFRKKIDGFENLTDDEIHTVIKHEAEQLRKTKSININNPLGLDNKTLGALEIKKVEQLDPAYSTGKINTFFNDLKKTHVARMSTQERTTDYKPVPDQMLSQEELREKINKASAKRSEQVMQDVRNSGIPIASSQIADPKAPPNSDNNKTVSNKRKWGKRAGYMGVGMAVLGAAGLAVNSLMINDKGRMNNAQMYGQQPYSQY